MNHVTEPTWPQLVDNSQDIEDPGQQDQQKQHLRHQQKQLSTPDYQSSLNHMAASGSDEDFSSFLDLGDIDLNIPFYNDGCGQLSATAQADGSDTNLTVQQDAGVLDVDMSNTSSVAGTESSIFSVSQPVAALDDTYANRQQSVVFGASSGRSLTSVPPQSNFASQQSQMQYQQRQQQKRQLEFGTAPYNNMVYQPNALPPTPASLEMRPLCRNLMAHSDTEHSYPVDPRYEVTMENADFTPLISPAVTPRETIFDFTSKFAVPSAYFSPLSSPALEAQTSSRSHSQHINTADSSAATSPVDVDFENFLYTTRPDSEKIRKYRKHTPAPRSIGPATTSKVSPQIRPRRRKGTSKAAVPSKDLSGWHEDVQQPHHLGQYAANLLISRSRESSDGDSTSPETLSDIVMGPPPKPNSVNHSPSILAQQEQQHGELQPAMINFSPATPASLMQLPSDQAEPTSKRSKIVSSTASSAYQRTNDLTLPDADALRPIDLANYNAKPLEVTGAHATSLGVAKKSGTSLRPIAVPSSTSTLVPASKSPNSSPLGAPISGPTAKNGRSLKKRNSGGLKLVSPALRPKISPSIKPLLPEGGKSRITCSTPWFSFYLRTYLKLCIFLCHI